MRVPGQIPHLVKLVDDDDPAVREVVLSRLAEYGDDLVGELAARASLSPGRIHAIERLVGTYIGSSPPVHATALFAPGQLVRHRRYAYRGVVVSMDDECLASDFWYQANRTQPDREQPWYQVLVHGSRSVTYAAQTSLRADASGMPVEHPLVFYFFQAFRNGRHVRNTRRWPDRMRP